MSTYRLDGSVSFLSSSAYAGALPGGHEPVLLLLLERCRLKCVCVEMCEFFVCLFVLGKNMLEKRKLICFGLGYFSKNL